MSVLFRWLGWIALCWPLLAQADAPTCNGRFINPVTDICWSCLLPISIGSGTISAGAERDIPNPSSPVCACTDRIGVSVGFWEPARQIDVTRTPFCMVALGGISLGIGLDAPIGGQGTRLQGTAVSSFYHAHYYINPVLSWLEVILDYVCLDKASFDVAYLTEVDPLWNDDETTLILNPDAVLFANPAAIAACAADCVAASTGVAQAELFWCAGCQGMIYPLNGRVPVHIGGVQASSLIAQRLMMKLHRELVAWGYHGSDALCGPYIMPVMDKTAYKTQLTYPIPNTGKVEGRCCQAFGETTALWGAGKEFPIKGEDFSYMVFRKRNCCAF